VTQTSGLPGEGFFDVQEMMQNTFVYVLSSSPICSTSGLGYGFTTILTNDTIIDDPSTLLKDWQQLAVNKKTPFGQTAHLYSITSLKESNPEVVYRRPGGIIKPVGTWPNKACHSKTISIDGY
jgi:hypothetical protein